MSSTHLPLSKAAPLSSHTLQESSFAENSNADAVTTTSHVEGALSWHVVASAAVPLFTSCKMVRVVGQKKTNFSNTEVDKNKTNDIRILHRNTHKYIRTTASPTCYQYKTVSFKVTHEAVLRNCQGQDCPGNLLVHARGSLF